MKWFSDRFIAIVLSIMALESAAAQPTIPLVDIKSVDPTIVIELRYSGPNNLAGRALYSRGTPALVRPEVASRLVRAQAFLGRYLYRLKIWDAYRFRRAHSGGDASLPRIGSDHQITPDSLAEGDGTERILRSPHRMVALYHFQLEKICSSNRGKTGTRRIT